MVHYDFTSGVSAQDLRRQIVDRHLQDLTRQDAKAARVAQKHADAVFTVRHRPLADDDFKDIVRRIYVAAELGQKELVVLRFHSALCSDKGRSISAGDPDWGDTLPVRPKSYYDHWETHKKPLGYHLKAMILDYPNGMPGEVGLILDWKAARPH